MFVNVRNQASRKGDFVICIINPRRACAARVTVVVLCVCVCVCLSVRSVSAKSKPRKRYQRFIATRQRYKTGDFL